MTVVEIQVKQTTEIVLAAAVDNLAVGSMVHASAQSMVRSVVHPSWLLVDMTGLARWAGDS
jgi:hypothetical protein